MDGEVHGVRMHIDGMPVMECPHGHKRLVTPDFAVKFMDALMQDADLMPLQPASQRGLLRKRYCCPACSRNLDDGAHSHVETKRVVELSGIDSFGVSLEVPKFRCTSCGREYVPPGEVVAGDLIKASANAFRSAAVSAN
jgi:hypothetical protein